jgi:hypothetical protein
LLQFFCGTNAFKEITKALQLFIDQRKSRIENSIEVIIYPLIEDAVSKIGNVISARTIWELITGSMEGYFDLDREGNKTKPTLFHSEDHGDLYMKTITALICDKFGAKLRHGNKGNLMVFNRDYLLKIGRAYDITQGIQTSLVNLIGSKSFSNEIAQGKSYVSKSDSGDSGDSTLNMHWPNGQINNGNNYKNKGCCSEKIYNLLQKPDINMAESDHTHSQAESQESPESPLTKDLDFPTIVTSTGTKMYRCPFWVEGCRIQNIHPEEIELHFKCKHTQDGPHVGNFSDRHNSIYNQTILLNSVIPRSAIRSFLEVVR